MIFHDFLPVWFLVKQDKPLALSLCLKSEHLSPPGRGLRAMAGGDFFRRRFL